MSGWDFWSRRKAAVAAEEVETRVQVREEALAERPDEEILSELGLPDPDTLTKGDNFQAFLTEAVPARLRRRALRRLWISDPVLASLDDLVDYGEDFTDAACAVEGLQTAYQVGKGMARHVEEMERQAEAEEHPSSARGDDPEDLPPEGADEVHDTAATGQPDSDAAPATATLPPAPQEPLVAAPSRRMRFQFEETGAMT